jgi:hypothetical protein
LPSWPRWHRWRWAPSRRWPAAWWPRWEPAGQRCPGRHWWRVPFLTRAVPGGRCRRIAALAHGYERWDGAGFPDGLAGEAVPLAVRVAVVAHDAELWWRAGPAEMTQVLRARQGHAYDPAVAEACLAVGPGVLAGLDQADAWQAMLAASPGGDQIVVAGLDPALEAVADFADLKSPWTRGHSPR